MAGQMRRYSVLIAYRGTHYHGWQRQAVTENYRGPKPPEGHGIPTIQEIVSRVMGKVVGHPVNLVGSSRTDAGVHAKGQIAHFDTDQSQIPVDGLRYAVNARLPGDILVRKVTMVPNEFDAITSTISKRYQYQIWNADDRPVLFSDMAWHRWRPLDIQAMQCAANRFLGTHDFTSFARAGHGKESAVRTILSCDISKRDRRVIVGCEGTGFLWNMVRIMVGTLVEAGLGRYTPEDIDRMLAARDRRAAGLTAPPHGLYLQWIRCA